MVTMYTFATVFFGEWKKYGARSIVFNLEKKIATMVWFYLTCTRTGTTEYMHAFVWVPNRSMGSLGSRKFRNFVIYETL